MADHYDDEAGRGAPPAVRVCLAGPRDSPGERPWKWMGNCEPNLAANRQGCGEVHPTKRYWFSMVWTAAGANRPDYIN